MMISLTITHSSLFRFRSFRTFRFTFCSFFIHDKYLHRPDRGTTICIMCKFTFNINTYRICTNSCNDAILHLPKMVNVVLWGITGFWLFCYYIINIHTYLIFLTNDSKNCEMMGGAAKAAEYTHVL